MSNPLAARRSEISRTFALEGVDNFYKRQACATASLYDLHELVAPEWRPVLEFFDGLHARSAFWRRRKAEIRGAPCSGAR